ncbi:hypothetical protein [Cupriavidus sp. UYPR2.512]|uniref:hypothetical protein n=1 Tax=Cupriavidus sp. UYPR2.512 TaxID=1080187 RepID=UPI000363F225|nr:hypothetical protein [Cupriavidus sp. UYPR2.512]UIF89438.1 hypothetical protein KAF44_29665 [Cupriavidus necator]
MKLIRIAAVALVSLAALSTALAQQETVLSKALGSQGDDEKVVRQRVLDFVIRQYGNGTPLAAAALTYARAAGELWLATARTQKFDPGMTERAGISEICFRGQLAAAGVSAPDVAVSELEHVIASTQTIYAGAAYATVLAMQHPRDLAMTPAQACRQSNVPLP